MAARSPRPGAVLWLMLALLGCPVDDDDVADDDSAGDDDGTHALLTTTDFTVGALATVDLADWTVADEITAATGDPVVQVHDGLAYQINRFQHDAVRVYDPPDFQTPLLEFSTGAGSNPQWVVPCAGALFVTRYEMDSLGIFDPGSGLELGEIDLSAYVDGDGLPEAASMVRVGDHLYAGLQRMDRDAGWQPDPDGGRVLEIDCVAREITREWETGANVMVHGVPGRTDGLLLTEGALFDPDYQMLLDGGVRELALTDDAPGPLRLTEETLGGNIVAFGAGGAGLGLLALNVDEVHQLLCVDLTTWETTALWQTTSWIPEIQVNDRDQAFVPLRSGPADPAAPGGIAVIDLTDCADLTGDAWIAFSLQPYSVGFY